MYGEIFIKREANCAHGFNPCIAFALSGGKLPEVINV